MVKLLLTVVFAGLFLFALLQIEEHSNIMNDSEEEK